MVRHLINEGADIALEDLPEDLQTLLTHQMAAMRLVDRETVDQVIDEFASELEAVGMSFPGGMAGALAALDGKLSPHTAARLRKEAGVRQSGNPWERIQTIEVERLAPIFQEESVEICAIVLSKLDVKRAAELLGKLPGPLARQITYAVSQTSSVSPEAVDRIGLAIATQLDAVPTSVFDDGPVQRVGAILNSSTAATRDDVLNGLEETDKAFASEVKKAIFTFANVAERVASRDIPTVLRGVDQGQLVIALAHANAVGMENVTEFILANMSKRLAEGLQDEINELGDVAVADGEAAQGEFVAVIRELETSGELILLQPEDGEEED